MNHSSNEYGSDRLLAEYRHLLLNLKTTAEALFLSQACNVWNVYGGLNRLHDVIENIFQHGTKVYKPDGTPDSWLFIEGLNWINPSLASNDTEINSTIPYSRIKNDKALIWIYNNLENHTLSQKLCWLISDKEHLASCFEKTAYLCQESYSEATLICLRAIEQNQPSIITDIDPYLFLDRANVKQLHKLHRRCSSYPEYANHLRLEVKKETIVEDLEPKMGVNEELYSNAVVREQNREKTIKQHKKNLDFDIKSWSNFPIDNYHDEFVKKHKSNSLNGDESASTHVPENNIALLHCEDIKIYTHNNINDMNSNDVDETAIEPDLSTPTDVIFLESDSNTFVEDKSNSSCMSLDMWHQQNLIQSMSEPNFTRAPQLSSSDVFEQRSDSSSVNTTQPVDLKRKFSFFSWDTSSTNTHSLPKSASKLSQLSNSAPGFLFTPMSGEVIKDKGKMMTFIEDGGSSIPPMASGFFPKPQPGESLLSFLRSSKNIRTNAELDRENAHFSFSEAMIAAVEQLKYNRFQKHYEEVIESDEEINDLKQRIRIRRRQREHEKAKKTWDSPSMSDAKTDAINGSASPMFASDSWESDVSNSLDLDVETCPKKINDFENISASLESLYSTSEIFDGMLNRKTLGINSKKDENLLSAECVALSLISRFNEEQLPKASDLIWLVSEEDVPQSLLPLPDNWSMSPSDKDSSFNISNDSFICGNTNLNKSALGGATPLRGTEDWAPPRAQVIFTPHPKPQCKKLLAKQNYRCAGCSMHVAPRYGHKFRYCEYLGKLFCTGCHSERLATIPGQVLSKWDFKRYQVSNFSYRLLERMWNDPLFRVDLLAPGLYTKSKALFRCKMARIKLSAAKEFIITCRFAPDLHKQIINEQSHIYNETDVWSMNDFIQVKNGDLLIRLNELVKNSDIHVTQCELCTARGFVCEFCCKETIFPWQSNVTRCEICGSCYHSVCWNKIMTCSKCIRIGKRKADKAAP